MKLPTHGLCRIRIDTMAMFLFWVKALVALGIVGIAAGQVPNWMPCEDAAAKALPFCDHKLPTSTRVANLLSLMTQDELCQQTYDKMGTIAKVPSWKGYNWNTECLHGLGGICHTVDGVTRCPSAFPGQ